MCRLAPLLVLAWFSCALGAAELDQTRIAATAQSLIDLGPRNPGSPGAEQAVALISEQLRAAGLKPVSVRTTVAGIVDAGSTLEVAGKQFTLTPHRPNKAAVATTGGTPLQGPLLILGQGQPDDLRGKNLHGAIVVLDGNTADRWIEAAQLGAAAVVFRRPGSMSRYDVTRQGMGASVEFPRFVVADIDDALSGQDAVLTASVHLAPTTAWTVCVRIPGRGQHNEAILLSTGYESPVTLAALSPGVTAAWNAATLLEIVRTFASESPDRDTVAIFHGGSAEHLRGLRQLTGALSLDREKMGFSARSQLDELRRFQVLMSWRGAAMLAAFQEVTTLPAITLTALRAQIASHLTEPPLPDVILADQLKATRKELDQFVALLAGAKADVRQPALEALRNAYSPSKRRALTPTEKTTLEESIATAEADYQRYRTVQQKLDYEQDLDPSEDAVVAEIVPEGITELIRHLTIVDRYRDDYTSLAEARAVLAGATAIHLIGLNFSDGNTRFAAAIKGTYVSWLDELGWLTSGLVKLADDVNKQNQAVPVAFERAAHDSQDEAGAWFGGDIIHDAGVAGMFLPAATLTTVADARIRQGSPQDDSAHFDQTRFLTQVTGLGGFLAAYVDAPFIANRKSKSSISYRAPTIETEVRSIGSKTGYRGFPYPFVMVQRDKNKDWEGGIGWEETFWGNAFGKVRVPFVPQNHPALKGLNIPVSIYGLDATGYIIAAPASGGTMRKKEAIEFKHAQVTDLLPLVFMCERSRLFGIFDPRLMVPLTTISVLSATRDSAPNFFHVENSSALAAAAIFSEPTVPLRITATLGQVGNRMILTGHAALERQGVADGKGRAAGLEPGLLSDLTALDCAEDTFHLNDERLALLRRNGINPDSTVMLHSLSEQHLEKSREALASRDYEKAIGEGQTAWALAGRVYPTVLSTANDIVYGLVIMLLFAIPFAWICERLALSGSTIVRKVVGFIAFFVAVFLFFFFFHPAFELATTPMVIFLAFVILIMSSWVIALLYNRFEFEMEQIRMSGMGMHKADVSRLGTLFATVGLGISNMRRRPTRTFLTALTVVLMTFILLTFASFNPSVGSQKLGLDAAPPYSGILVRQNGWVELASQTEPRIRRAVNDRFELHPIRWLGPTGDQPKFPVTSATGLADVGGVVGISADDPHGIPGALMRGNGADAPRGFADDGEWLFLPRDVLTRLGVQPGDEVRLRGVPFKAGVIDHGRMSALTMLGGDPITPLAFDASDKSEQDDSARLAALAGENGPSADNSSAIHLSPTSIAFASQAAVQRLGGTLQAIALTPRNRAVNVPDEAEDLARQVAATLRVGTAGESYLLTSVGRMSVAGLGAVLIPLILGGLIIFSTMLNSVAERGKEIFIFSSLGLAPIHVAALFLVEAAIYAVVGGLGGYILAQLIISGLGFAADLGFGVRPDINYSSFTAVATILLVMFTVLLSALYPALIASKAANPGTVDFRVPDPVGDRLEIDFPFTVAARDVRGLCAFLTRYFDSHTEAAGGCFTAADARMDGAGKLFEVHAKIWLAPFDLGISQQFTMACKPTDVRAIYAVHLTLDLLSGQRSAWKRTNLAFLKDLRQQFLVWRTLSLETMDQYRAEGGDEDARARVAARLAAETAETAAAAAATNALGTLPTSGGAA